MTIYLTDDAFSVKVKRFNKTFTSILALFFLLRIANKSHFYARSVNVLSIFSKLLKVLLQGEDLFCCAFAQMKAAL